MADPGGSGDRRSEDSFSDRVRALAQFLTALAAFIGAIYAIYKTELTNRGLIAVGKQTAENAANIDDKKAVLSATGADLYVVQLASYLPDNCDVAKEEVDSYRGKFKPDAGLWSASSGKYVVVGIQASSLEEATKLEKQAKDLSSDPGFASNDLRDARARTRPDWKPLGACPRT